MGFFGQPLITSLKQFMNYRSILLKMNPDLLLMTTAASSSVYNSPLQVASWLTDMGLNIYSSECKRWNKSGRQILEASQQEIDKELRIANPLHRKKLHLALEGKLSYYQS